MSEPPPLPAKHEVALALLEGPWMFVHLDPRREGVTVPKQFRGQPQLVLQLGLQLAVPIPDLEIEPSGISATLSFDRRPFWCRLPWSAVFALVGEDGRGMVWPDDVPPELAMAGPRPRSPARAGGAASTQARKRRRKPRVASAADSRPEPRPGAAARPALSAVPTSEPTERGPAEQQPSQRGSERGSEGVGSAPQSPASPKRKLPPYLRVIK